MMTPIKTQVLVIGSGPGGYSAAFRAADLGKEVILIESNRIGGVCLNTGCIPSKTLLHAAKVMDEAQEMAAHGIQFGKPKIDIARLLAWKNTVVNNLTGGLDALAKKRKVTVINGFAEFSSAHEVRVTKNDITQHIEFDYAIIAAGSRPVSLPFLPIDPRIIDSTAALELKKVDGELLVIGGGIIGLEMATVYHALGAQVTIVERMEQLIPGCDKDLITPYQKRIEKQYKKIMLATNVTAVEAKKDRLWVSFSGDSAPKESQGFDQILVAVGRTPNGKIISAEKAGVFVDERGFIPVDSQQRTNIPHIFAIGDIVGNPMLAHKASPEGRIAAEVIAGKKHHFMPKCIPSVAYTDPEIAWTGLTENEAKAKGLDYGKGVFPWIASGRSLSMGRNEGLTKLLFDNKTNKIIGAGITGPNAGELIAELSLAIEMNCDVEDISLTIHPHPTLSETIMLAAEIFEGSITDLYMPKKTLPKAE